MRATVKHWRNVNGAWCPGYQRDGHVATDLTADHLVPIKFGGLGGPLVVLCKSCNSRKGAR